MVKHVTVTLVMVLAALNEVNVPLLRASQPSGLAPLKPSHCLLYVVRPFWFDEVLGAAEAPARTYAAVPAPSPTRSMTSAMDRVEKRLLVVCVVSICDIF